MKEENPSSETENLPVYNTSLVCAKCAAHMQTKQQDYFLNIKSGSSILRLIPLNIVRIKVDGNYCAFEVLLPPHAPDLKRFDVRSTLSSWEYLIRYGMVRVSRHTIINLAHIYQIEQTRLYSYHLPTSVEVTNSYHQQVTDMLNHWLDVRHRFAC